MEHSATNRGSGPRARLALLGRVVIGLMLLSGGMTAVLMNVAVATAATSSSTGTVTTTTTTSSSSLSVSATNQSTTSSSSSPSGSGTTTTATNAFPLSTNATSYTGATAILVRGVLSANSSASDVSISIANPRGVTIVSESIAVLENSSFSATILASYPLWNVTGRYTVTAMAVIADFVGAMPTSVAYFEYTAVPVTTTATSPVTSSTQVTSSTTSPGSGVSIDSILPIVAVVVIVVVVMGVLLRTRGRRRPAARPAGKAGPAPKAQPAP